MTKQTFSLFVLVIVMFGLLLNITATRGNHFYFTTDQGEDAIYVREILEQKKLILVGPKTNIPAIHNGFLWYYFISIGYLLFKGSPYGAVFMTLVLSLTTTVILMFWIRKKMGPATAIITGMFLQIYWRFFENSLWGFNPFPTNSFSIITLLLLTEFLSGKKKYYIFTLIPMVFAFHAEIAAASSLLIFYFAVGLYSVIKKRLSIKSFITPVIIFAVLQLPLAIELVKVSIATLTASRQTSSVLGVNFVFMVNKFLGIIGYTIVPQFPAIGVIVFTIIVTLYLRQKSTSKTDLFVHRFLKLTLLMVVTSFLFFASNKGWRDWHTFYLYPILFITFIFICLINQQRKFLNYSILTISLILHLVVFMNRFANYQFPSTDSGILANEMAALDWIYTHNDHDGFRVFTYTKSFYDYPYQYLFWWYGKKTYGFVPCEYANFPKSNKETYIPSYLAYSNPNLGCGHLSFIIIDSKTNGADNADWIDDYRKSTKLLKTVKIGQIMIEERSETF